MKLLGQPFAIQNTDGPNWFVTWADAATSNDGELVSFTVCIPRRAELSIAEVQRHALKRAVELLQKTIRGGEREPE